MRNINWRKFIFIIVFLSAVIWYILARINGVDLSKIIESFSLIPKVVFIDGIIFSLFAKWGWKHKIFKGWLVPFPDLNGSWFGYIHSDWVNPETGKKIDPVPTMLVIKQTFFNISCVMQTQEMKSTSYSEGFDVEPERQIKQLSFLYTSKPSLTVADRSHTHDGAAVFEIIEKPDMKLNGRYWTERKTIGEIKLNFKTTERLEELPED